MKPNKAKNPTNDLVDIRSVQIDPTLSMEERIKSYVEQIKNPYLFKVGDTVVQVEYANNGRSINDNFLSLLISIYSNRTN